MSINSTAIVDPAAKIDASAEIGPYVIIDGPVTVGPNVRIYPHAYLTGWTEIGANCQIHPYVTIGHVPQDRHFEDVRSYCKIGQDTIIREYASIHRGTQAETSTIVGQNCFILAYAHVGHNCVIGDDVTLINSVQVGGHTTVGKGAVMSALSSTHQFARIGEYAMIGGGGKIVMDALPFMTTQSRNGCSGLNTIGLKRNGFTREEIGELKAAYKLIYRSGKMLKTILPQLETMIETPAGQRLLAFLKAPSKRGLGAGPRHAYRHSKDAHGD